MDGANAKTHTNIEESVRMDVGVRVRRGGIRTLNCGTVYRDGKYLICVLVGDCFRVRRD